MDAKVRRIFVEKRSGVDVEARQLFHDLKQNLGIAGLKTLRVIQRYDIEGISAEVYARSRETVFSEPPVDRVWDEVLPLPEQARVLAIEYLPGQYDQRADSAAQCIQILTQQEAPRVRVARLIVLEGDLSSAEHDSIQQHCINPLDSQKAPLRKPDTLELAMPDPADVAVLARFTEGNGAELQRLRHDLGLAMSHADLVFCQKYFRESERRDPTLTEIRVLDTYWSDHCRHTTFLTRIDQLEIEPGPFNRTLEIALADFERSHEFVLGRPKPDFCLMELATQAMKEMRKRGELPGLDVSEEVNACSIIVDAEVNGRAEPWLVMFKNETHNHPTEIEPFGGAATCLGGAIRDPLSGRSYVYQALRVTGSGDPRTPVDQTLPGKLPQNKITRAAAAGFSSYGNQIGLATGQVVELYHPGFVAKRMEIGAVIGAAPRTSVVRARPQPGDVVLLVGGRTGRDGCGGATGSSKEHTEESLLTCGAEVQKGNPPTERKLQRLFRDPEVSRMIRRANDFGAGGVAVAIGELADGLEIRLDSVPKKYEGLDGTELAISESQERMAVVVAAADVEHLTQAAARENLEATPVAVVSTRPRLRMFWRGRTVVDISRDFLNTNGVSQRAGARITAPAASRSIFWQLPEDVADALGADDLPEAWLANMRQLNVCSQKGLVERFDSTIGAGSVLMPFGGREQLTPAECMAAKLPVLEGETSTATLMSYGYHPAIGQWSPFHGAVYAIVEAVAKITAAGGDYRRAWLSLQEYFEKLGQDPVAWGKPVAALLGAFWAQRQLGIAAIGGKDSMSGTFRDLSVPPTLVAFAVATVRSRDVMSSEFKKAGSPVLLARVPRDGEDLPDFSQLKQLYEAVHGLFQGGHVIAAHSVRWGGVAEAVSKMCFGNRLGFEFSHNMDPKSLFAPDYGSLVLELTSEADWTTPLAGLPVKQLGTTQVEPAILVNRHRIPLHQVLAQWRTPLESVFPTQPEFPMTQPRIFVPQSFPARKASLRVARPKVFLPVFPGTNCEFDTARAFQRAGADVETAVFRNRHPADIEESLEAMVQGIERAQIVVLAGGFSAGDEPEGSGKFIATIFRNPRVTDAVMWFLRDRDGLMLGICNGFQALIKLGLVPYGEVQSLTADSPTLTYNALGRHVSTMVRTRVISNRSPWLQRVAPGDIHTIPISHGEGRLAAGAALLEELASRGQIATQYVDLEGRPSADVRFTPNGSADAIEGITSPDGRVFGKMAHSERIANHVAINVPGEKDQKIFEAGVAYFS